jgi:hypothetical protein
MNAKLQKRLRRSDILQALLSRIIIGALRGAALLDSENFEAGCNLTKNNFAESKTEHRIYNS